MKKKIVLMLSFIAGIFILAGLVVYFQDEGKAALTIDEVSASGPIFYLRAVDLEGSVRDFQKTEFVKRIQEIDLRGTMKALGAKEQELAFYDAIGEQIFSEKNLDIFLKLFGQEAAVIFYPPDVSGETAQAPLSQLENLSVVARLRPEVQFIEVLMGAAVLVRPEITQTSEEYGGENIYRVSIEGVGFPIVYVRFGDLLIFGIGDAAAKRAVDVVRDGRPSLTQDAVFEAMGRDAVDGSDLNGFFHFELFAEKMKDMLLSLYQGTGEQADAMIQQQMIQGFKGTEGMKVFYFSSSYDQLISTRVDMTYDRERVSEKILDIYLQPPIENRSLSFIPETVKLYFWNSFLGPQFSWDKLKKEAQQKGFNIDGLIGSSGASGFDIDKAMSLLTGEIGWYFFGMDLTGIVPLPKGVVFAGVRDMDQVKTFVREALEKEGTWRLKTEIYKGREIGFLESIPFLEKLEPAYVVMENYLLLGVNRGLIEEAIDLIETGTRALEADRFMHSRWGSDKKKNVFFFGNISGLADELAGILRWGNQWADVQHSRRQAFRSGAQKRLENIENEFLQKQEELNGIQELLSAAQEKKEGLSDLPEQMGEVRKELDRRKQFLENVQKSLAPFLEEEKQLLSIEDDEGQQLTEAGLKLLEELQADIGKRREREQGIRQEITELEQRYEQFNQEMRRSEEIALQISEHETLQVKIENDMEIIRASQIELQEMIREYDQANLPTAGHREIFLKELADPLLSALSCIEWIIFESRSLTGRIRSEFFIQVN